MRFFSWVDFQFEMLAVFLGLVGLILVYAAWAGYRQRRRRPTSAAGPRPETGIGYEEKSPVPPFLIFVYLGIGLWALSYLVYIWTTGIIF